MSSIMVGGDTDNAVLCNVLPCDVVLVKADSFDWRDRSPSPVRCCLLH